jgi:hypothetical protein
MDSDPPELVEVEVPVDFHILANQALWGLDANDVIWHAQVFTRSHFLTPLPGKYFN